MIRLSELNTWQIREMDRIINYYRQKYDDSWKVSKVRTLEISVLAGLSTILEEEIIEMYINELIYEIERKYHEKLSRNY